MQSYAKKRFYTFRADANALGGYLEEPVQKNIPTLAPVSLPAVGGFATARSEAFSLDEIVSCTSAYSRVSGREHANGSTSILVTSVVEGLNILEVVRAERIVAQVSISIPAGNGPLKFSLAGSGFEGLRLAGEPASPKMKAGLLQPNNSQNSHEPSHTWESIYEDAEAHAQKVIGYFAKRGPDAAEWARNRHGWMDKSKAKQGPGGTAFSSMVESFHVGGANADGHIVEIPGFGRITLGELLVSQSSVQLVALRADLGCSNKGGVSAATSGGSGVGEQS
jgi:hypothetical protein